MLPVWCIGVLPPSGGAHRRPDAAVCVVCRVAVAAFRGTRNAGNQRTGASPFDGNAAGPPLKRPSAEVLHSHMCPPFQPTQEPPPLTAMRLVPLDWCVESSQPPQLVWEFARGMRPGCLWRVGMMGLLWATAGATGADSPPQGPFYTLRAAKIKLAEVTPRLCLQQSLMPKALCVHPA
eukprot:350457-Chlamydomonas_euryale.AAC.8